MKVIIRLPTLNLLRFIERRIIRPLGYVLVPVDMGEKGYIYGDSHRWTLDLSKPCGSKVRCGIPYLEDYPGSGWPEGYPSASRKEIPK